MRVLDCECVCVREFFNFFALFLTLEIACVCTYSLTNTMTCHMDTSTFFIYFFFFFFMREIACMCTYSHADTITSDTDTFNLMRMQVT